MKCIYCEKPNENELIFETEFWQVILSSDQGYLGRCYVILKRHCGDLAELTDEEWLDFSEVVKKLESALKKSFNATMFNWTCLMNNAYQSESPNPHVHWHFRPRYNHKVEFAGLIFEDPEFGHHYDRTRKQEVAKDIKIKILEKIKENL
jgi:diadenosine tetraphosphate (Ap4A) HIT family hydrolase